ncbi:hypothetical protein CSKR_105875 [Clonorchis sinensis]|uniref:Uncharacterized protein n=1 Tax=Clonorchis sinensis TaxID=79923 RepID=A0A8T1N1B1_CLOSI|nr:hypothetical protein CSKR_105875 [Clonorchis sinensis]
MSPFEEELPFLPRRRMFGRRGRNMGFGPPSRYGRSMRPGMMSPEGSQMDQEMSPSDEESPFSPQRRMPGRRGGNMGMMSPEGSQMDQEMSPSEEESPFLPKRRMPGKRATSAGVFDGVRPEFAKYCFIPNRTYRASSDD